MVQLQAFLLVGFTAVTLIKPIFASATLPKIPNVVGGVLGNPTPASDAPKPPPTETSVPDLVTGQYRPRGENPFWKGLMERAQ